ncbi:MAG: hypothetical protein Q8Q85_01875 [Gemmatimonadales bacterium]|nr:hypothetical protein [Gemmatimonadales bacterium]
MPIIPGDLKLYGSATMPDDDTTLNIGGAIDAAKKVEFKDINPTGNLQIVSSAADITQTVTISGRDAGGAIISEVKTLSGTTPVAMTTNTSWERILKAVKSATTTADVAIEAVTAERTGTAQAGGANTITLDATANATDDFYKGHVIRLTAGTGINQIREIIGYVGATKVATVAVNWGTNPDATSVFRISQGCVFDKSPNEITQIRRPFYNAVAPTSGTRKYYDKLFFKNTHATLSLTTAQVVEQADPTAKIAFGLAVSKGDTGGNGAGNNRQVAPSAITFDSATKAVPTNTLAAGETIGVWVELSLAAGDSPQDSTYTLRLTGNTV